MASWWSDGKIKLQPEIYAFKLEYLLKSFHIISYAACSSKGNGGCKFWTMVWGSTFNWFYLSVTS